mgnify:CR=1 FL=1
MNRNFQAKSKVQRRPYKVKRTRFSEFNRCFSRQKDCCSKNGKSSEETFHKLLNIPIDMTIRLCGKQATVQEILNLKDGSVLQLNNLLGEEIELLANQKVIAVGKIVNREGQFAFMVEQLIEK